MTALPKDGVADLRRRIAELEQQLQSTVAERDEAIAQQAATADVLQVINSSPADLAPVFEAILDKALQPCDAQIGVLWTYDGKSMHASAIRGAPPAYVEFLQRGPHRPSHVQVRLLGGNEGFVQVADLLHSEGYRIGDSLPRAAADLGGIRTLLVVPLRKHGAVLGTFGIYRQEVKPFSDRQIALVESFAAQAVIAMENARLFNETKEALERQTATSDILKVIASSPSNVQPVFDAIARRANTLVGGFSSTVFRFIDGIAYLKSFTPTTPAADEILKATFPRPVADFPPFRMAQAGEVTQVPDTEALSDEILEISRARGFRSMLFAPLMHDGMSIGFIAVTRVQPGNFADHHVQLLQTFADQAVIAIENARLFEEVQAKTRDLTESLQQQTATADVLKVISRSAFDLQAVLHTLVESAARLCDADRGTITRQKDGKFYRAESFGHSREFMDYVRDIPVVLDRGSASGRALLEGLLVHIADVQADPEYTFNEAQRLGGYRTCLGVPILREGVPVGVLSLTRSEVRPFTDKQIELVTTFADQAAIAIENARLFEEVQAKTGELTEALTYQTGSSNILSVIASSPTDVAPVLKAIVESASELCDAYDAIVLLKDGDELRYSAHHGPIPNNLEKWPINRSWTAGRAFLDQKPVHVRDLLSDEGTDFPDARELSQQQTGSLGIRTLLSVPLLREHESIGAILLRRIEVHPFSEKQIALLQTFADQAVIAIGNVHLFEEVQARTEDLRESLDFQTASSDVLKVISSSPDTLQPVLDVIVGTSRHLCGTETSTIFLLKDDKFHIAAASGAMPEYLEFLRNNPIALDQAGSSTSRAAREKRTVHIPDIGADPEFGQGPMAVGQRRALLSVPLMREGTAIGVITMRQSHLTPFTERQIEVVQTFADQAVIAISNVRLFEEVQAKTRDLTEALTYQTGSSNILGVIASSPTDVKPVLKAIVESAGELCDAYDAIVLLKEGDELRFNAHHGPIPLDMEKWPINRNWTPGRALIDRKPVHVHDMHSAEGNDFPEGREMSLRQGQRTVLSVPLLREGEGIGAIVLRRTEVHPFSDKQIALLQTFADQAVIAIGNVRLFEEVQAKTRDLTEALTYQTGSSKILSVIASSPTDVGPVLKAIVESACELCDAYDALVRLKDGDDLVLSAHHGPIPTNLDKVPINYDWTAGRAFLDQKPVHVHDLLSTEGDQFPEAQGLSRFEADHRTILSVPLLRESESIGAIVLRRTEVHPFSDKQIALLQTFADQAVIAIGNVRLFEEVQARTRDLTESLQQQTATAEVLKVISASPGELEPVFQAMLENAVHLCEAKFAMLFFYEKNEFRAVGKWNLPPAYSEFLGKNTIRADPKIPLGRVAMTKQPVQVADVLLDQSYIERFPAVVGAAELGGARTVLQVPMLKENELVGTVAIYRQEVRPFTDKQISLVQNFAAQGVIAIENARLLNELRQRTDDLTASLHDLRTAQDRLVQTEKLASLGQLTAGIAHEIKNPLNFVNNFSALSAELTDELNDVLKQATLAGKIREEVDELTGLLKDNLQKVVQHGKRADSIVKNMLLHSREGSGEHRPADINALLDESLNLAYHGARAEKPQFNVTLQRNFDPNAGLIEVFPQEITRVFLNLISNGFYAVTKRKADNGAGFDPVVSATTRDRGDHVEIRIRDNGTGIPQHVKEKMFNPFFTTKPAGEGTGLGLSMSHDIIVKQHGGTIDVVTEPGQFTEFTVVLPRTSSLSNKTRG